MDLISTKICVAIIFAVWRFFFAMLPLKLDCILRKWEETNTDSKTFINEKRHQQVTCFVALTQSFGGGVLFATCFLHMMKELFLSIDELRQNWGISNEYPASQLIIAIGFFFVYFLEEFTHWFVNHGKKKAVTQECVDKVATILTKQKDSNPSSAKGNKNALFVGKATLIKPVTTIKEWTLNEMNKTMNEFEENMTEISLRKNKEINDYLDSPTKSLDLRRTSSARSRHSIKFEIDRKNSAVIEEEKLAVEDEEKVKHQEQLMRCILTIVALSFHAILEGLSIGIQEMQYDIWYLFIAVSIHSASILFCMSVELILAQTRVRFIVLQMTALTLASPVGIMIGCMATAEISERSSSMSVASFILEGLSAGTILYITFFEVLNREKERRVYRLKRGLCIIGGFTLMALLQYSESRCQKHGSHKMPVNNTNA